MAPVRIDCLQEHLDGFDPTSYKSASMQAIRELHLDVVSNVKVLDDLGKWNIEGRHTNICQEEVIKPASGSPGARPQDRPGPPCLQPKK